MVVVVVMVVMVVMVVVDGGGGWCVVRARVCVRTQVWVSKRQREQVGPCDRLSVVGMGWRMTWMGGERMIAGFWIQQVCLRIRQNNRLV